MYLSKSDFKIAQTCPTKLFYKKRGHPSVKDDDEYLALLAEGRNSGAPCCSTAFCSQQFR